MADEDYTPTPKFNIGDTVRVIANEDGYVSPLSIMSFPPLWDRVMPNVKHPPLEGETGTVIAIWPDIWPDRTRYVLWIDSAKDKAWFPFWFLEKIE